MHISIPSLPKILAEDNQDANLCKIVAEGIYRGIDLEPLIFKIPPDSDITTIARKILERRKALADFDLFKAPPKSGNEKEAETNDNSIQVLKQKE